MQSLIDPETLNFKIIKIWNEKSDYLQKIQDIDTAKEKKKLTLFG